MFRLSPNQLEIYKTNHCPHCELIRRLHDRPRARLWLAQFASDTFAMKTMRDVLSEGGRFGVSEMSDAEVMDVLAELLGNGSFHVHAHSSSFDFGYVGPSSSGLANVPLPLSQSQRGTPFSAQVKDSAIPTGSLWVRLDLTHAQAVEETGKLRLRGTTCGYNQTVAIASSFVPNASPADTVDVHFENVPTMNNYSLTYIGGDGRETTIVQDSAYDSFQDDSLPPQEAGAPAPDMEEE